MPKPISIDIVVGDKSYEPDLKAAANGVEAVGDAADETSGYVRDLNGRLRDSKGRFVQVGKAAGTSKVGIDQLGGAVQLLGGVISVLAIKELGTQFLTIADNAATLQARVSLASEGLGDASENMEALIGLSAGAGQDLGQVVTLFEKMTLAAEGLGASNEQLLQVTDTVAKLTSGVEQSNATAALQQLGQALGNDIIMAEEFNSIQENTPLLLNTVADALGMSTNELKKMQRAGELTSDMFFNGLLLAQDEADRRFGKMPRTIEKASAALDTRLTVAIGTLNTELGLTDKAIGFIDKLAELIRDITPTLVEFSDEIVAVGVGLVTLAGAGPALTLLKGLALVLGTLAGPVGLFAAAAAGAAYFMLTLNDMPKSVEATKNAIADLEKELEELAKDAEAVDGAVMVGGWDNEAVNDEITETTAELATLREHLKKLQDEIDGVNQGAADLPTGGVIGGGAVTPQAPTVYTQVDMGPYRPMAHVKPDEERYKKNLDELMLLAAEHRAFTEQMETDAEKAAAALQKSWDSFGEGLSSSLARSLLTGENMVDDFLKNVAEKIIQAQLQEQIFGPLMGAAGKASEGGGVIGFLGGLVSSAFAPKGFATGGQMPANRVALVGENGPELISTGNRGAYVTPSGGGMGLLQINITNEGGNQVASRSATAQQTPEGLIVGIVIGDINDNGPISRSIQSNLSVGQRT